MAGDIGYWYNAYRAHSGPYLGLIPSTAKTKTKQQQQQQKPLRICCKEQQERQMNTDSGKFIIEENNPDINVNSNHTISLVLFP